MANETTQQTLSDDGLYPIRTIASLTGVNPVTLRAWERRYGLIKPQRTPKGHRLYTSQDIERIRKVLLLLKQGLAISQVGQLLDRTDAIHAIAEATSETDSWSVYRQRMRAAIDAFDETTLEQAYNDALSLYPDDLVNKQLSIPLLQELGKRWKDDPDGIAREHFFTHYLRNKLGSRIQHTNQLSKGPLLLVSCLQGEYHEVGMLLFAVNAVNHGYRVLLLGANTPLDQLPPVIGKRHCAAIVLSMTVRPKRKVIHEHLPSLVSQLMIPVFVGGNAAEIHSTDIDGCGAICVGADVQPALEQIKDMLAKKKKSKKQ